jgi:hypothetical protein
MAQDVDARLHVREPSRPADMVLHDLLSHGGTVILAEHALSTEVTMLLERLSETNSHRDEPYSITLGTRDVPLPVRSLNRELSLVQVHILLFQRHYLAASESRFSPEQNNERRTAVELRCCLHQPIE